MPEPYGSPEFREGLEFPDTKVGLVMQQLHEGLGKHGSFVTAMMEDQFRRMGEGKPGEEPQDPLPFSINGVDYTYSVSPKPRQGFLIDDSISVERGNDSLFLQVSHSESDPSQMNDEVVLKLGGQVFKGEEAIGRISSVFPEFTGVSQA